MPVSSLQKGSPYLDDVNELIEIARQSGMIDMQFKRYLPFASKCLTYADRQEHNIEKDRTVAFKLENIYGILILFAVGLGGCVITMLAEKFVYYVHGCTCTFGFVGISVSLSGKRAEPKCPRN